MQNENQHNESLRNKAVFKDEHFLPSENVDCEKGITVVVRIVFKISFGFIQESISLFIRINLSN